LRFISITYTIRFAVHNSAIANSNFIAGTVLCEQPSPV
jgi:hypothetical protein